MRLLHCLAALLLLGLALRAEDTQGLVLPFKQYKQAGESVVKIDQVFVQFYLDPKLMPLLKADQAVTVRCPVLNDEKFTRKINFIALRIDPSSGLFRLSVWIDNPADKIKAGARVL